VSNISTGMVPAAGAGREPLKAPANAPAWRALRPLAWASVPLWSLGLLAFVPFLRLALTGSRRSRRAWAVFGAYLAVDVVVYGAVGVSPSGGGLAMLALMAIASVHAFAAFRLSAADLRSQQALAAAQARMKRRQATRELVRANPALAHELGVGRPDLAGQYDDGGLIDVNHVPEPVLTSALDLTPAEAKAIEGARARLGSFVSAEEVAVYAGLEPGRLDEVGDLLWFG
jgi:hypothetical protein